MNKKINLKRNKRRKNFNDGIFFYNTIDEIFNAPVEDIQAILAEFPGFCKLGCFPLIKSCNEQGTAFIQMFPKEGENLYYELIDIIAISPDSFGDSIIKYETPEESERMMQVAFDISVKKYKKMKDFSEKSSWDQDALGKCLNTLYKVKQMDYAGEKEHMKEIFGEYNENSLKRVVKYYSEGEIENFEEIGRLIPANKELGTPKVRIFRMK